MKEAQLKASENKQVIFASYGLSSEGLDIPTLNAEFLITPKTDVVQITGRVLRAKHKFSHPIIYDFVDSHDVFQRQWLKRKAYYKKQNYKIIGTNSVEYNTDTSKWREIYQPKNEMCVKTTRGQTENEDEEQPKDNYLTGVCLLNFKK
jgi:superfamily II DNA or RNA helicase